MTCDFLLNCDNLIDDSILVYTQENLCMFKSNQYFDGKVMSIAFKTETLPATVGVMAVGDYVFNTAERETMTVISGELQIKLTDSAQSQTYTAGQSFEVPANSAFDVKVPVETAYLCLYG
jgi:hypothetical protein